MVRFNWHADYFDALDNGVRSVRRAIIQADNADAAEKIAKGQMGLFKRVDIRRVATAAPVRTVYSHVRLGAGILSSAETRLAANAPANAPKAAIVT
jgi:hypothetical protein